jgi:hypothetical protein
VDPFTIIILIGFQNAELGASTLCSGLCRRHYDLQSN